MTDVTAELLPDHPILKLVSTTTNRTWGIVNGEVLGYRCVECGVADEDVRELIHENGCTLRGETAPHDYADRRDTEAFPTHSRVATDGGEQ